MATKKAAAKGKKTVKNWQGGGGGLLGGGGVGIGGGGNAIYPPYPGASASLSQVDTIYKNTRFYLISNQRQILSEVYVEHGIIQTIVDVPVNDAFRGGVDIKSKQLAPEELEHLMARTVRLDDLGKVAQAQKWNRLFGGAAVLIVTDADPSTPFDESEVINGTLEFKSADMWELFYDKQNAEGFNPTLQDEQFEFYNYYGIQYHKTRVMRMKGLVAPSFVRPRLRGWGFSVVEALVRSLNQYLKSTDLVFEVLDEFKIDIYKIKNLTNTLLSPQGAQKVWNRITEANQQKNFMHALSMDSEDDYMQKELSFAGIAEIMTGIRMQIASDLRMPLTKVFGISASGFSSGEDDIENYNAMVESDVRQKCKFDILRIIELRALQLFGYKPTDMEIDFKPLRILSSEQEENVKTSKFNRIMQAVQANKLTDEEFRLAVNKDDLLGIQLDPNVNIEPEIDPQSQTGSNQVDTEKVTPDKDEENAA